MVNNEIFEGLKLALSRGYTLEQAMLSFFNAGYKREEIEEAARALQTPSAQSTPSTSKPISEKINKKIVKPQIKPIEKKIINEEEKQKISKYEGKIKPKGKLITILLIIFLLLFVGILLGALIFRKELIDFLSSFF